MRRVLLGIGLLLVTTGSTVHAQNATLNGITPRGQAALKTFADGNTFTVKLPVVQYFQDALTVPAGTIAPFTNITSCKRVIDYVNVTSGNSIAVSLFTTVNGREIFFNFNSNAVYSFPVQIYSDSGTPVRAQAGTSPGSGNLYIAITGHCVP